MKSFNELSRTKKIIFIAGSLLAGSFFLFDEQDKGYEAGHVEAGGFSSDSGQYQEYPHQEATGDTQASFTASANDDRKVVIYDKGLQMPISTIALPEGWKVEQDIAFDPNTARPVNFKLDIIGPRGELNRAYANIFEYGWRNRKNFEQAYQEALGLVLNNTLNQVSVANLVPSQEGEQNKDFRKMAQKLSAQGMQVSALEVAVSGQRNGQAYQGKIAFAKFIQPTAMGEVGMLQPMALMLAPANHYEQSEAIIKRIGENTVKNPAHEQRMDQINQRVMQEIAIANQQRSANAAAAHRQRMANNQAAFDASQRNISEMNQLRDANHNSFMNDLRNSGSYNTNSNGYSSHDAYIDQIHERSTFNDPWSGQEMHMDGQYDYNYTNGLGDYYRTDDPNFDHNSLQGDWQQIEPEYPY
ncbi:hypothetical protein WJR50_15535 [Catalinimonas sp. 4WD22]|uniref:hypothetical protein n=1 Tax=Catalinimonas locisalis TaxID=3133978 RepID=UPI0031018ECB